MEDGLPLSASPAFRNLVQYLSTHPQTCVVDDIMRVEKVCTLHSLYVSASYNSQQYPVQVFDRIELSRCLSSLACSANGMELRAPNYVEVCQLMRDSVSY